MQVKIQEPSCTGYIGDCDDTSMNAIRLTCSDGTELISKEGPWGTWSNKVISADGIFGVTLRTEQDQGSEKKKRKRKKRFITNVNDITDIGGDVTDIVDDVDVNNVVINVVDSM